jgi:hypothetical protein
MKKIILSLLFLMGSISAWASAPVIFYSDLTSGPNSGGQNNEGDFVTIWGNNFGSSQGSSTVTVGGGAVYSYLTWTNTEICFQLGSSAASGNIVVTTSGGTSNGISFTVRSGAIYFVNPAAGSNGTGTYASPFNHLYYAVNIQAAGDTIYVMSGTIENEIDGTGGGYNSILDVTFTGATSASPVAYVAYPNATVTLEATGATSTWTQGSAGGSSPVEYIFRNYSSSCGWITIAKFYMIMTTTNNLGTSVADEYDAPGWRVVGNNIQNIGAYQVGAIDFGGANIEVLGNEIHGGYDSSFDNETHSIYVSAPSNPYEIGWNYIHSNYNLGWEISTNHDGPRIGTIHDNVIVGDAIASGPVKGILADGDNDGSVDSALYTNQTKVYNNVLINVGYSGYGGAIQTKCGTNYIYNNTIYGSGTEYQGVIQTVNEACGPSGGNSVMYLANNIIVGNVSGLYISNGSSSAPTWSMFTVLAKNNYYGEGNGPTNDTTAINANPVFVSPAYNTSGNFNLQSSSPDVAPAGYNTTSIVANDYNGVTRPNPPAVGAYEYSSGCTPSCGSGCTVDTCPTGGSCGGSDGCTGTCGCVTGDTCTSNVCLTNNGGSCTTGTTCVGGYCCSNICQSSSCSTASITAIVGGNTTIGGETTF